MVRNVIIGILVIIVLVAILFVAGVFEAAEEVGEAVDDEPAVEVGD